MADGLGTTGANAAVDAALALVTYAQFHTGAPGAAGTSNIASNSTRVPADFNSASAGVADNNGAIESDSVPTTETYTHISFWSAITAGNFIISGSITGGSVTAGNNFVIADGQYTVSAPLAS